MFPFILDGPFIFHGLLSDNGPRLSDTVARPAQFKQTQAGPFDYKVQVILTSFFLLFVYLLSKEKLVVFVKVSFIIICF